MSPKATHKPRRGASVKKNTDRNRHKQAPKRPPLIHRSSTEFCEFIDHEAKLGCDPFAETDEPPRYIPLCALKRYWTRKKIGEVFREQELFFTIDTIRTRYLRTFSLLVYTGQASHLACFAEHNLSDAKLPLSFYPSEWPPKTKVFLDLFERISKEQWMFFPLSFDPLELEDVNLDDRVVVPILPGHWNRIAHGDAASVYLVTVHDRCNTGNTPAGGDAPGSSCHRSFALKTYHTERSRPIYENEIKALRMFSNFQSPNIIKYHGSFRQNGHCNILTECAEGDLTNYFQHTKPPPTGDVALFWKSISQVLNGLERVHHLVDGNRDVFGIHEDIKPDNILVFLNPASAYDFTPKIVDFGLFSRVTRSRSSSSTAMGGNTQGTQIYSSPESSYNVLHRQRGPTMVTTKADIFSMAAVLSAACAWVAGGTDLQRRYFQNRKTFHEGVLRFKGTAYKGCFHDGDQCIRAVYDMHEEIRRICEDRQDSVTPAVLDILEKHVFDNKERASDRSAARDIYSELDNLLREGSEAGPGDDDTLSETSGIDNTQLDDSLAVLGKGMTVKHLASSRTLKDGQEKTHFNFKMRSLVDGLKLNVGERDHFFLIDDSRSMAEFRPLIKDALQELFVITKDLDPNKVELSFASAPSVITKTSRRVNKLLQEVDKNKFRRESDMLDFFPRFLDQVIKPRLPRMCCGFNVNFKARFKGRNPTSVYIFTDGNWGDGAGPGGGLKGPLEVLINDMQKQSLRKEHVSFHFVRFGDSEDGKGYLGHLDHFGKSMNGWDIVDVKDLANAEVHTIILGPLSPANDILGEESD